MSAHCILKNIDYQKHVEDLKIYKGIFGKQNPVWNGKRITKRYLWSHFVNVSKKNMFSKLENRYFFHNAISLFKKKTLQKYPFHKKLKTLGRDKVCELFEENLSDELKAQVGELKGKALGCWCHPERCHCDYLAKLANDA